MKVLLFVLAFVLAFGTGVFVQYEYNVLPKAAAKVGVCRCKGKCQCCLACPGQGSTQKCDCATCDCCPDCPGRSKNKD